MKENHMRIAYTMSPSPGDTDEVLARLAAKLAKNGLRTCGIAQINTANIDCQFPCDMDVQVLPDGPTIRISQSLGREAKGCRLDPAALEDAVADVNTRLQNGADVLILNKFGKHEADGRGFRDVIAEALSQDIPVITGVNKQNLDAFMKFTGGIAEQVPATIDELTNWLDNIKVTSPVS
jgi:nucleoside-triphosphatase THEP1